MEKRKDWEETDKLLATNFIREARYTTWLANVVMVTKPNGKSAAMYRSARRRSDWPQSPKLFRCILWLQPNKHASEGQREDGFHDRRCKLLPWSNAIRTEECRSDLPGTNGQGLQGDDWQKCGGLRGRHSREVRLMRPTYQRPTRGLRCLEEGEHAAQHWKVRVRGRRQQVPGFHVDPPRDWGQSRQVLGDNRDEEPAKPKRSAATTP